MVYALLVVISLMVGGMAVYGLYPKVSGEARRLEAEKIWLKSELERIEIDALLDAAGVRARLSALRKAL